MLDVLLSGSASFIITFLAIPVIMRIASEKKLFDVPDARKLHKNPIASLGGVGIFTGFFLACLLSISAKANPEFQYFFAAAFIIFFLGLKDDIIVLSATKKLMGQIAAAAIVIHLAGVRLTSMHGLFGIEEIPNYVGLFLSYFTIVLIINAYNLIDGVDGLAGMLGLLTMSIFGCYFYMAGIPAYSLLAFSFGGSLIAFLIFNHNPAKIFMGDCGSLVLGLINAILVIKFISVSDSTGVTLPIESAATVGISILIVPLMDTLRVFSIRVFHGRSPFSPDRNHIHHLLLDRGLSHKYVTLFCLLLNMTFVSVAYFGRSLGPTYLLFSMALIAMSVVSILIYYKKPAIKVVVAKQPLQGTTRTIIQPETKVVAINKEVAIMAEN
jgi:UDP-N-acetylmuramyl pentapeptide phosphotransferase/UDP-N-acetylglucosamine-1-phosphate transferase